ncbi:MAG: putative toxin-antitoxin system toxin component, PIN family [Pyrinomonadaceae bacterium]
MISAVFDTNIFFQGILVESGPAGECIKLLDEGRVQIYLTRQTVHEIEDVIARPALVKKYPVLTTDRARIVLRSLASKAIFIAEVPDIFRLDRDVDDEILVNLAVVAGASYLVTRDRDLLDLMDDLEFRNRFPNLNIVTPVGFLEKVRAS